VTGSIRLAVAPVLLLTGSLFPAGAQLPAESSTVQIHGSVHTRGVRVLPAEAATPSATAAIPAGGPPAAVAEAAPTVLSTVSVSAPPPRTAVLPASVIKGCVRPIADPDLRVDAAADLQKQLKPRLRTHQRVVLDLIAPYTPQGGPPSGLAPWLDAVKGSGGTVSVAQYCEMTRGFGDWLARMFATAPRDASRSYSAARGYDVILHADALDRTVTQVEFVPRAGRAL
jgi:hypothetical protein